MIANFIESVNMAWNNFCAINKIILIIAMLPSVYLGIRFLIKDTIWLINKIF